MAKRLAEALAASLKNEDRLTLYQRILGLRRLVDINHRLRGENTPSGSAYSGFAIGVDRSHVAFRGFLPRKTTPRDLYGTKVIAKPL